ncbi:shikimate dehydrogenase family protein [Propioniciclava sinopodophylli]|uniref:shikimate dehydrogenase family protein n=1 Tax=Propioniciclava sinopodophylli TaxID=1837344 RepID=UPI00249328F8|nr:shikimate dehydrogenase [Propioniciclava sinopodophylli]
MTPAPTTHRCAVLGRPIEHSLSPLIHTTAYAVLGIADDWSYGRHEVDEAGLAGFVAGCGPEWVGLSCTAPLKQAVLDLGRPTERARLLASGNTFLFNDGDPWVENTDVTGLVGAFARAGVMSASTALLLGNGATARSALAALAEMGVTDALVLCRSRERAEASLGSLGEHLGVGLQYGPWGTVPDADATDVLVSTVSTPLPPEVAAGLVSMTRACFEATYNHYPTELDRAARAAGVVQLSGIDLLVGQAVDQVRLMTGRACPPGPLLEVAYAALD